VEQCDISNPLECRRRRRPNDSLSIMAQIVDETETGYNCWDGHPSSVTTAIPQPTNQPSVALQPSQGRAYFCSVHKLVLEEYTPTYKVG